MNTNIFLAIILSMGILVGYQYLYVKPHLAGIRHDYLTQQTAQQSKAASPEPIKELKDRNDILKDSARITIATPQLAGSINLQGALIDDLSLTAYHETEDPNSPSIVLLSPSGSALPHSAYYAEFSWLADSPTLAVPGAQTKWQSTSTALTPDLSARMTWDNGQGLSFERTIAVDDQAMFTITDRVVNTGPAPVTLYPFGTVARQGIPQTVASSVVLEGALGVLDGALQEYKYKKLMSDKKIVDESIGGWLGITDKYWLVAMIPPQSEKLTAEFAYHRDAARDPTQGFFQTDFRGGPVKLETGASTEHVLHLFAGAKNIKLLDQYGEQYNIPHFDKAIDFGWFYFLTRPFLYLLTMLQHLVGSIGLAILVFTVILKLVTLPLSLKSYHSMSRMKALQPEMKRLQERYADDMTRRNQEMMEFYKREKVSPVSGCGPTLIQIPIFFALYKVLYINIAMRQAPFYGWIHDMSVADPTSVFTLFGMLPISLPIWMHVGVWPVLMGLSMFLQQKLSPQPPDQSQARMLQFMPIIFTFLLARMPAGLVIYWTWSNLIGIAQQWYIMKNDAQRKMI